MPFCSGLQNKPSKQAISRSKEMKRSWTFSTDGGSNFTQNFGYLGKVSLGRAMLEWEANRTGLGKTRRELRQTGTKLANPAWRK
jgi:hypothetical protein